MVYAKDIVNLIEKFAPLDLQYSWDNSGFLCGDINKKVSKVYITLDVNISTVNEAVREGADMIISHHPILFRGVNNIDYATSPGCIIKTLVKNDIALYSSHTPMDCAKGGINDILADKAGIINKKIIENNDRYEECGLGRIGELKNEIILGELAEKIKSVLNTPFVRICGDKNKIIKTAAVGGGACDDLIPAAKAMGADVMITSDMKYHISMDAVESGICIIDAGHYSTENFVIEIFEDIIKNLNIDIVKSSQRDIFNII